MLFLSILYRRIGKFKNGNNVFFVLNIIFFGLFIFFVIVAVVGFVVVRLNA